jgi:hypothetical protein
MAPDHARIARAMVYEESLGRLGAMLAERGLAPVLVKGQAIADRAYPASEPRLAADVDLLVGADDSPAVAATLIELGYHERLRPERRFSQPYLGERQFHCQGQVPVELHTDLDKQVKRPIGYAALRARAVPSGRPGFRYPTPEDLLLLVIIHASSADGLDPARPLEDLHRLISGAPPDWRVIAERAAAWHLTRALGYWLEQVVRRHGTAVPTSLVRSGSALAHGTAALARSLRLPGGVQHFIDQLAWHDSAWAVLTSLSRYGTLRLRDHLEKSG